MRRLIWDYVDRKLRNVLFRSRRPKFVTHVSIKITENKSAERAEHTLELPIPFIKCVTFIRLGDFNENCNSLRGTTAWRLGVETWTKHLWKDKSFRNIMQLYLWFKVWKCVFYGRWNVSRCEFVLATLYIVYHFMSQRCPSHVPMTCATSLQQPLYNTVYPTVDPPLPATSEQQPRPCNIHFSIQFYSTVDPPLTVTTQQKQPLHYSHFIIQYSIQWTLC